MESGDGFEDIFQGVKVIEPLAFPVWQNLMSVYPKDHFNAIIKQVAEQLSDNQNETYDKLIAMVKDGIKSGASQIDNLFDQQRERAKQEHADLLKLREEQELEKWRWNRQMEKQAELQDQEDRK